MRNFTTAFISALLVAWLFGGSWWYINVYRSDAPKQSNSFVLNAAHLRLKAKDNFFFSKSSSTISVPQSTRLAFLELAEFLRLHPNQHLQLTGLYDPSEVNDTALDNLGIARAEALKSVLIDQAAPSHQIHTAGLETSTKLLQANQLLGGVLFSFQEKNNSIAKNDTSNDTSENSEEEKTEEAISIESLNLYFTKSKYKLSMTPELKAYFDKLKKYLNYYPEAIISITGHTDNLGKRAGNLRLSKYRARKVSNFMVKHGFPKKNLKVYFKGPDEPIGDNATEVGRNKNRRVEIRIKE